MFEFCFCSDGNVLSDRKKNTIYNPFFFLLPIVFLCTFKPTDLKMVILFWFDFLSFRLSLLFYINYQKFRLGMRDWTYHRFTFRSWGLVTFLLRKLSPTLGSRGYFFLMDTDGSRRSRVNEDLPEKPVFQSHAVKLFDVANQGHYYIVNSLRTWEYPIGGPVQMLNWFLAWKWGCVLLWPEVFFSPRRFFLL